MKNSIFKKIFSGYLIILFAFAVVLLTISLTTLRTVYLDTLTESLEASGSVLKKNVASYWRDNRFSELDYYIKHLGAEINTRITVVKLDGVVLADSEKDPRMMENHKNRPEIVTALETGHFGSSIRYSTTVRKDMLYVAQPLTIDGNAVGVVRMSLFLSDIHSVLGNIILHTLLVAASIFALSMLGAMFFSRYISRPVNMLVAASNDFAQGDFDVRVSIKGRDELRQLADSFNNMASRIKELFETRKRAEEALRESESTLRSFYDSAPMAMGIVEIRGDDLFLVSGNTATSRFLAVPARDTANSTFTGLGLSREFVSAMIRELESSRVSGEPMSFEYAVQADEPRWLSITGSFIVMHGNFPRFSYIVQDITRRKEMEMALQAAHDSLEKKVEERTAELKEEIVKRRMVEDELRRLATTDSLTGVNNRWQFMKRAEEEVSRAHRYSRPLAVFLIDVDHFKKVNDTWGHHIGDEVLKTLAIKCRGALRQTDVFGRLGGEEFAIVVIETKAEAALRIAERIRTCVSERCFSTEAGDISITISIGVVYFDGTSSLEDMLKYADAALYEAKESGRNRVILANCGECEQEAQPSTFSISPDR